MGCFISSQFCTSHAKIHIKTNGQMMATLGHPAVYISSYHVFTAFGQFYYKRIFIMNNYQKLNSVILALSLSVSGVVSAEPFPPEHLNINLELQAKQLASNSGERNTERSNSTVSVPFHIYQQIDAARRSLPVNLNVDKTAISNENVEKASISDAITTSSLHLFQHYN